MEDHVYKMIELAGSSETSIEDAIQNAITRAAKTLHDLRWFQVIETPGHIEVGPRRPLSGRDQGRLHDRGLAAVAPQAQRGRSASLPRFLHRWARHRAVRAEHAAVSLRGLEQGAAASALMEVPAGVGRHGLGAPMPALRAGQGRLQLDRRHRDSARLATARLFLIRP